MIQVLKEDFEIALEEIIKNGDNDTLPYDIEESFLKHAKAELPSILYENYNKLYDNPKDSNILRNIYHEEILTNAGSNAFRIVAKIDIFWNIYLNGLAIALAKHNENNRSDRVHSYRFYYDKEKCTIFDKQKSWRTYKEATIKALEKLQEDDHDNNIVVVQTDIASFYDTISHHSLNNHIDDVCKDKNIANQIEKILGKITTKRSFGIPIGGQASRIFAEIMLHNIDINFEDNDLDWYRYVDDYSIICPNKQHAYTAISYISKTLSNYGLSLNKAKTSIMTAKHYKEYIEAQLGNNNDELKILRDIDIKYDPYSDTADEDYNEIQKLLKKVDFLSLLQEEQKKSEPDSFVLTQATRSLVNQSPEDAKILCETLLEIDNISSFRAVWSKIMKNIYRVRKNDNFNSIFNDIDRLLDNIIDKAEYLLGSGLINFSPNSKSCEFYHG